MKQFAAVLLAFTTPLFAAQRQPVRARHAMVASTSEIASRVGAEVMRKGGNAVDAAIAVGFALTVTLPAAGNIGGGGFMLIRNADGSTEAIDYRERAPLAATRDMYLDAEGKVVPKLSTVGWKAVAVPGTVAGLALAHKRHGKLKWVDLVEPARKLAAEGIEVGFHLARNMSMKSTVERLADFPESRRIYQRNGRFYEHGERFVQPELARTLARIQANPRDFYEGDIARAIVAGMKANGGIMTAEDLRIYQPVIRQPLRGSYRGLDIITMPPPSSGGIALLEMLNMLEPYDLKSMGWHSSQHVHTLVEVMRRAFADRAEYLGDADFGKVPAAGLISRDYAAERRKDIDPEHASTSRTTPAGKPWGYESPQTTHFTIVDPDGNVVANTYTLDDSYGSGVTVPGMGFLLNDEMDDFTARPGVPNEFELIQGKANAIEPKKRPLSSMAPTIVLKDGKVVLAFGSAGGASIITSLLQVFSNVIDFGFTYQEAVDAERVHHQWLPDKIYWEVNDIQRDTRARLESMGHHFQDANGYSGAPGIADVQAIFIEPNGMRCGASDPRRGGAAVGW